ncbi:hypothetical protein SAY86_002436 [Trapa natans]|uniref:J domain-containing protein n=1 Tax=Trapa natans TaxID=22666 RepID=A0AAN7R0M2_TRANT|nr:hypothetical protein SAY86_002436 [Trapa natans]
MECNKDEAIRAKQIAEMKFMANDMAGAKKFALKAQSLYPGLEGISQMLASLDVHVSAENKIDGLYDWYGILGVSPTADSEAIKKQFKKLALMLHPDKNKYVGADGAFKLVFEAWSVLSDTDKRGAYDMKRKASAFQKDSVGTARTSSTPPPTSYCNSRAGKRAHPGAHPTAGARAHPTTSANPTAGARAHPTTGANPTAGARAHPTTGANPTAGARAQPTAGVNPTADANPAASARDHPTADANPAAGARAHPTAGANPTGGANPAAGARAHPTVGAYPTAGFVRVHLTDVFARVHPTAGANPAAGFARDHPTEGFARVHQTHPTAGANPAAGFARAHPTGGFEGFASVHPMDRFARAYPTASANPTAGARAHPTSKVDMNAPQNMGNSQYPQTSGPSAPNTFWTVCYNCMTQFEYPRIYVDCNLLCRFCRVPFYGEETTSRRLADRKVGRFEKNITRRGSVPETATKKGKDYPVGPMLLGFFVFVVIGSYNKNRNERRHVVRLWLLVWLLRW